MGDMLLCVFYFDSLGSFSTLIGETLMWINSLLTTDLQSKEFYLLFKLAR